MLDEPIGQTTVSITLSDGTTTPPVSLDMMREAVSQVRGGPKFKPDTDFGKQNDAAYNVTADELRQFVERYEHLQAEKADISEQQKEVMAEAKGRGYDTKVMKKIIALRKRDKDDVAEEEAILEMYKAALGMG